MKPLYLFLLLLLWCSDAVGQNLWGNLKAQEPKVYTNVRRALKNIETVEILDLSHKKLRVLPEKIRQLDRLKVLILHHNFLTELPPWISELSRLESLDLSWNILQGFPSEIDSLLALKELSIDGNGLTVVALEGIRLDSLQVLRLSHNEIGQFSGVGSLAGLRELFIDGNQLSELPAEIELLGNLEFLRMGDNPITDIDRELKKLVGLSNLKSLQIYELNLGKVPEGVFELQSLEFLSLIYNHIDSVPVEGFEKLTSLKELWLYDWTPLLSRRDVQPLQGVLPRGCIVKYKLDRINTGH